MFVYDIEATEQFYDDYKRASPEAKKAINKYIRMISVSGRFPNGFGAKRTKNGGTLWRGRVTVGKQGWRVLFDYVDGLMTLDRLLPHSEYDHYLKMVSDGRSHAVR